MPYVLILAFGFILQLKCSLSIVEGTVSDQLAYLIEKYAQVDKKLEDLTTENMLLRYRVDVLTKENIGIKEQMQSLMTQNSQINKNDEFVDDFRDKRDTRHLNHFEHNGQSFPETGKVLEEADFETEKQLDEANLQQISDFSKSNPDLDTKEEKYRVHLDFQQVPATKRSNGDLNPVQVEYQKEKRLLLGSVTTPSPSISKVAFSAILTTQLALGQHQIVEYDKVLTNIGNGYDSRHGHFTAPIRAVYLFSCSMMNIQGISEVYLEIVKNGIRLAHLYSDKDDYSMATQVVTVLLDKGDMVWVRHSDTSSSKSLNAGGYNTFVWDYII